MAKPDATAVHGAHLAVDDAAHTQLLHGGAAGADVVMSATVVMPLDSDSRPPRMAESYQSATSILADSSRMVMIQVA